MNLHNLPSPTTMQYAWVLELAYEDLNDWGGSRDGSLLELFLQNGRRRGLWMLEEDDNIQRVISLPEYYTVDDESWLHAVQAVARQGSTGWIIGEEHIPTEYN